MVLVVLSYCISRPCRYPHMYPLFLQSSVSFSWSCRYGSRPCKYLLTMLPLEAFGTCPLPLTLLPRGYILAGAQSLEISWSLFKRTNNLPKESPLRERATIFAFKYMSHWGPLSVKPPQAFIPLTHQIVATSIVRKVQMWMWTQYFPFFRDNASPYCRGESWTQNPHASGSVRVTPINRNTLERSLLTGFIFSSHSLHAQNRWAPQGGNYFLLLW